MKKIFIITIFTILCFQIIGVSGSLAVADLNNIRATIYSWQEAWQSKDIYRYKLFYSKKFKSDGFDYQRWMNKKEKYFATPGAISIELFDLQINTQNDRIIATFIQRYKSETLSDVGEKTLILIQSDEMYKIIAEKFELLKEPTPSDKESLFGDQPHQAEPKPIKPAGPKHPVSHIPVDKRPVSETTINLTKLMHAPSLLETMQVISKKDDLQSVDTQKGEWQRVISANGRKGWINTNVIDRDASLSQKKVTRFTPKAPKPKVEKAKPTGVRSAHSQLTSGTGQTVISKTSLEWLYLKPTSDSKRVERLTEGKAYLAIKQKGDWVGLQLDQEGVGWTHQKYLSTDTSGASPFPKTMSAHASRLSKSPVIHGRPQEGARTAIRKVKLITPKVSFARAYEKPTIDSMILFRLNQNKRYILIETHGDWLRIEDDNGMTGWGHRTLFMKKIETADVSVTIDPKETKKSIPDVSDLIHERTAEKKSARAPDTLAQTKPSSERESKKEPGESSAAPSPFTENQDKEPVTPEGTDSPQDEPPLFSKDGDPAIDQPTTDQPTTDQIDQTDEQKEIKPDEAEPSSDENVPQLTIKNSNQLTPTVSLVRVYAKPSTDARIMFWLTKGKTYTFTDKKGGWYHIQLADGRAGWVHLALYMESSRTREIDKKTNEAGSINKKLTSVVILGGAHEKPALDSKVKFRLEKGVAYTAKTKQGSWYLIKNDNGDTGWAHKSLFDVNAPKPVDNAKSINDIRFEATPAGEEKVLFTLSGFYPPNVFLMEGSQSTLICDFSDIKSLNNLKPLVDINQSFVKRIRTEMHKDAIRVSIDLTPGKSYDVRQVFFKKENLFTLIFSTNEN